MADDTEVQSSTEETTETTEAQETETTEEQESSGAKIESADDTKDYRKIAEDQRKRAEKAEIELKKFKQRPSQGTPSAADAERLDRIELKAEGIKDRDAQDFVLSAAKRLGVSPTEAATDEIVAARVEKILEAKRTKEATPAPNRGGSAPRSNAKLPDFSKMTDKEFDEWERKQHA